MNRRRDVQVFSGNANRSLAEKIARHLGRPLGRAVVGRFPDGEIDVKVEEDVRGADVFVVQPTCPPVNENLMELLLLIDCFRRASADRITAVLPYFGYARQDRKAEGRVPISARVVANLITASGADRVLTMDLHAAQIQGFFDIPLDHLFASPVVASYFRSLAISELVVLSPDVGAVKMCRAYAKRLNASLAIVDKRRSGPDAIEAMHLIGEVQGRPVLVMDDMISTATSITQAARLAKDRGAGDVFIAATHPVFCGAAYRKIEDSPAREVVVTDSIPLPGSPPDRIRVLSIAGILAEAIQRIHRSESVSALFV